MIYQQYRPCYAGDTTVKLLPLLDFHCLPLMVFQNTSVLSTFHLDEISVKI